MHDPWADLAERYPAVHAELADVAPAHGVWAPGYSVILLDERLGKVERRCTLAHEIAHMDAGDSPTAGGWFSRRQEQRADRSAARRLIAIDDLASRARWCRTAGELATELYVTRHLLTVRVNRLHPSERGLVAATLSRLEWAA